MLRTSSQFENFRGLLISSSPRINEAIIKILLKGRSTKLRHVRTHRVNLDWLYGVFSSNSAHCRFRYVSTKHQIADIHIKAITKSNMWSHLIEFAQIINTPPAGSNPKAGLHLRQAYPVFLCVRHRVTMSAANASHGFAAVQEDLLEIAQSYAACKFGCLVCGFITCDTTKLKFDVATQVTLLPEVQRFSCSGDHGC